VQGREGIVVVVSIKYRYLTVRLSRQGSLVVNSKADAPAFISIMALKLAIMLQRDLFLH